MEAWTEVVCDICDCLYHTPTPLASEKTCKLCKKYPFAQDRFSPRVLLNKVIESGDINSLSRFELNELHISRIFETNPQLREIGILNAVAFLLAIIFDYAPFGGN